MKQNYHMLDGDVTAYEDSRGHKCSQCHNCQEDIKRGEQDKHFSGKDDNTPSYICPKGGNSLSYVGQNGNTKKECLKLESLKTSKK